MQNTKPIQTIVLISIISVALLACSSPNTALKPDAPAVAETIVQPIQYFIQPGDQLDVKFFYNPEINESVTVRPDGKISLQLIDEVQAAGLIPEKLDEVLTEKYAKELKQPVVTVIVRSFASQRIYVGGEVQKQGLLALKAGMTPLQAVIDAGGLKETALPEGAIVIRKGPDNKPIPIEMDLKAIMEGRSSQSDFMLQPHDIVYVPKTAIAKANKFVNQYIEKLILFRGMSLGFGYSYELRK